MIQWLQLVWMTAHTMLQNLQALQLTPNGQVEAVTIVTLSAGKQAIPSVGCGLNKPLPFAACAVAWSPLCKRCGLSRWWWDWTTQGEWRTGVECTVVAMTPGWTLHQASPGLKSCYVMCIILLDAKLHVHIYTTYIPPSMMHQYDMV